MSIAGGLHHALLEAKKRRCRCVQMFCVNQRQWRHPLLTDEQIEKFIKTKIQTDLTPIVVHGSYLINLAAADKTTYKKSIAVLI